LINYFSRTQLYSDHKLYLTDEGNVTRCGTQVAVVILFSGFKCLPSSWVSLWPIVNKNLWFLLICNGIHLDSTGYVVLNQLELAGCCNL